MLFIHWRHFKPTIFLLGKYFRAGFITIATSNQNIFPWCIQHPLSWRWQFVEMFKHILLLRHHHFDFVNIFVYLGKIFFQIFDFLANFSDFRIDYRRSHISFLCRAACHTLHFTKHYSTFLCNITNQQSFFMRFISHCKANKSRTRYRR